MNGGYTGKILNIDLNNCKISIKKTDLNNAKNFIGAKGLGAKILFDGLPKRTVNMVSVWAWLGQPRKRRVCQNTGLVFLILALSGCADLKYYECVARDRTSNPCN